MADHLCSGYRTPNWRFPAGSTWRQCGLSWLICSPEAWIPGVQTREAVYKPCWKAVLLMLLGTPGTMDFS
ncbi:hypothetical protein DNTS_003562 [Danionella cerebrum]|uniref:Uncharacterized protein n=1 Tax=Danionella cerebrum TaxID=2873325 RepID=A0A553NLW0_9TELE|nr:hypothetical protein DNTS_003562 [Danionella translucida]TRY66423.1 hypothetical protein DNTS_003562 [Danionella translucida]